MARESTVPHILLVEDNPGDVLLVKESFREMGGAFDVSVAKDGEEAIHFMYRIGQHQSARRPDLILLDLNLPKLSGHDVLSHLKGNVEFQSIPVVVLSSSSAVSDIQKAYALAANCYVCKPTGFDEFLKAMSVLQEFWFKVVKFPRPEPVPNRA